MAAFLYPSIAPGTALEDLTEDQRAELASYARKQYAEQTATKQKQYRLNTAVNLLKRAGYQVTAPDGSTL